LISPICVLRRDKKDDFMIDFSNLCSPQQPAQALVQKVFHSLPCDTTMITSTTTCAKGLSLFATPTRQ
jgi:hypothetical protein